MKAYISRNALGWRYEIRNERGHKVGCAGGYRSESEAALESEVRLGRLTRPQCDRRVKAVDLIERLMSVGKFGW